MQTTFESIFDYNNYINFMESKRVRHNEQRTNTPLDFVTEEQRKIDKENGIYDLSIYDPTPKEIKEHLAFVFATVRELQNKYPNDEFLASLTNEEEMQETFASKNWYEKYGIIK